MHKCIAYLVSSFSGMGTKDVRTERGRRGRFTDGDLLSVSPVREEDAKRGEMSNFKLSGKKRSNLFLVDLVSCDTLVA